MDEKIKIPQSFVGFEKLVYVVTDLYIHLLKNNQIMPNGVLLCTCYSATGKKVCEKEYGYTDKKSVIVVLFNMLFNFFKDIGYVTEVNLDIAKIEIGAKNLGVKPFVIGSEVEVTSGMIRDIIDLNVASIFNHAQKEIESIIKDIKDTVFADNYVIECLEDAVKYWEKEEMFIFSEMFLSDSILLDGAKSRSVLVKFPNISAIENYNNAFYDVLRCFIHNPYTYTQSSMMQKCISRLMNIGVSNVGVGILQWMYSPYVLLNMQEIYCKICNMAEKVIEEHFSDEMIKVFEDTFVRAIMTAFERWEYIEGKAYRIGFDKYAKKLNIECVNERSSIFSLPIEYMYDVIKSFYIGWAQADNKRNDKELSVIIIGDISKNYFEDKGNSYIDNVLSIGKLIENTVDKNKSIKYTVLLNGVGKDESVENISLVYKDYAELFQPTNFLEVLGMADLLIMLDTPRMFNGVFYPDYGRMWDSVEMVYNDTTYSLNFRRAGVGNKLKTDSILTNISKKVMGLTNVPVMQNCCDYKPKIFNALLDKIDSVIKRENKHFKSVVSFVNKSEDVIFAYPWNTNKSFVKVFRDSGMPYYFVEQKSDSIGGLQYSKNEDSIPIVNIKAQPLYFTLFSLFSRVSVATRYEVMKQFFNNPIKDIDFILVNLVVEVAWNVSMDSVLIRYYNNKETEGKLKEYGFNVKKFNAFMCSLFRCLYEKNTVMTMQSVKDNLQDLLLWCSYDVSHIVFLWGVQNECLALKNIDCKKMKAYMDITALMNKCVMDLSSDKLLYLAYLNVMNSYGVDGLQKASLVNKIRDNGGSEGSIAENLRKVCKDTKFECDL